MTNEQAAKIIDPETTLEAYAESEYYGGFNAAQHWKDDVDEACKMGAAALREKRGWINTKDKLPEDYAKVLTCDAKGNIHIMNHHHSFVFPFGIDEFNERYCVVTHWMPLPQPPKDE